MGRMTLVYVVDTIDVAVDAADSYVSMVRDEALPVMSDAGATLVGCWATSKDIGEDVRVKVVWSCADHIAWNEIRKNFVLDPRYYAYAARAESLRKGGDRRFYYPASFSPLG
jgi:hypothetical protein